MDEYTPQSREKVREHQNAELVRQVVAAKKWVEEAKKHYQESLTLCFDQGITATRLGRELGVSETAIRMYKKRHGL